MDKIIGTHFYVGIPNFSEIVKGDESTNDDIRRTIHRIHTLYYGIESIVNFFSGTVEKYSGGRAHIYVEKKNQESDEEYTIRCLKLMVATVKFVYNIFNSLGKYSQYAKLSANGGTDYGEYYKYDIINMDEFTTIGSVANVAAKLNSVAPKKYLYISDSFYSMLADEMKDQFSLLDAEELQEIQERLKGSPSIYKAVYSSILSEDQDIEDALENVEEECKAISNNLNLSEMKFENANTIINFSNLSRKKSKQIKAGVLYADIRGFTQLFNVSGSNLDDLAIVLQDLYEALQLAIAEYGGVRVQFQGDRIVAVFNRYTGEEDIELVRIFKAALLIKDKVNELSEAHKQKLSGRKLKVGIGLCYGDFFATRLGKRNHTDNQVLGATTEQGDIAEDRYAKDQEITVTKDFKDAVQNLKEESIACSVIVDKLSAISTTGYYKTSIALDDFENVVQSAIQDEMKAASKKVALALNTSVEVATPKGKERPLRPWQE